MGSWEYQKDRYKQVSIKFFTELVEDMLLFHYLQKHENKSQFIKDLIKEKMWEDAYNEK